MSASPNFIKAIASLVQLLFAIATLYQTRGDQVERYGYAAFGFTVIPYAWMSVINLVGNIMCPQYENIFVVESTGLDELRSRLRATGTPEQQQHFEVVGTVGRLSGDSYDNLLMQMHREETRSTGLSTALSRLFPLFRLGFFQSLVNTVVHPLNMEAMYVTLVAMSAPLTIIGLLSRFRTGQSALYQRVWIMMWLVFGSCTGPSFVGVFETMGPQLLIRNGKNAHKVRVFFGVEVLLCMSYASVAVGGLVVVAQAMKDFGTCVKID